MLGEGRSEIFHNIATTEKQETDRSYILVQNDHIDYQLVAPCTARLRRAGCYQPSTSFNRCTF